MRAATLLSLPFLVACVISPGRSSVLDHQTIEIPADGITELRIEAEAGWLEVTGESGSTVIVVEAEFVGNVYESDDHERVLKEMELSHRVSDSTVIIKALTKSNTWNRNPQINLTVHAPPSLNLEISDSSGDLRISDFEGILRLDDSSGDIVVETGGSSVKIEDSSGDMLVTGITGKLEVDDSAGDIVIRGAKDDIDIDDSSGDIEVVDVAGSVRISDSSGNVSVEDVGGDFEVTEDGSGRINYSGVKGKVSIPENKRK